MDDRHKKPFLTGSRWRIAKIPYRLLLTKPCGICSVELSSALVSHDYASFMPSVLDTFGTPKRVCSQFPFPGLGSGKSTGSGASRLAAPIRRHNDADRAVDPLIVAAASTTTFPFHAKYNSQAWEMGTGNKLFSVCQRCLFGCFDNRAVYDSDVIPRLKIVL
jgi:hypothetical protein